MEKNKRELHVAALCNGTAIDHIPPERVFDVVTLLGLEKLDNPITIGNNLESKKMGKKGIIKIADKFFEEDEISKIALIAPHVVLNIIRDYGVVEKKQVELPRVIRGIAKCNNPKCITNNEPMQTCFEMRSNNQELRCHYCDIKIRREDVKLT